jgi:hypothetical protein
VLLQIVARLIDRHPVDARATFVLTWPLTKSADLTAELDSDGDCVRGRVNLFAAIAVIAFITVGCFLVNSLVETQKLQGRQRPQRTTAVPETSIGRSTRPTASFMQTPPASLVPTPRSANQHLNQQG